MAPPSPPPPSVPGHRVLHHPVLPSTNRTAREGVATGALATGAIVVADAQTGGRGRRGRAWVTVPGRSLAASFVVATPTGLARPARLSLLAGVAVARALEALGASPVQLKWPNDLVRGGRKLGGLLIEAATAPDGASLQVVGVGVNLALRPGDLPDDLASGAEARTVAITDAGLPPDLRDHPRDARDRLLAGVAAELDAALGEIGTPADAARGDEYAARSWLTGRRVTLNDRGTPRTGTVDAVTPDGDLLLDGRLVAAETASDVRPAD